jgi:hypothetical protein
MHTVDNQIVMLSVISYLVVSAAVGWIVYWYTLIRTPANYPPGLFFCDHATMLTFHLN